ncbi:unnamed protein product [Ilex paraguariensis]|uniref:Uncharacterized protein n=1 Tax=Ilex paraguariensis TaxID=185542 RepID=A0ABC8TEQ7_9AQUA
MAEIAASDGKAFCISHVHVGSDTAAIREAVVKIMEQKVISSFLRGWQLWFSARMKLQTRHWSVLGYQRKVIREALKPVKGKGGGGKGGLAQGQGTDISHVEEAMDVATLFAAMQ